ncbi:MULTISPECIES: hydroxyacid dehydrogenase [Pseudomonas]|uniref:Hydroxyacid dehydrogenase n=1 Tax=Pseudomonas gingeri TaxID=117681 RepID=A0A7Y8BU20_9PSED|nr:MULTISPECIES: hydroxyacid dehydrogenase [Pseudomonas]MPQ68410.1 3-phosphoglycerate dehydrogenase [Pseudomonas sp. MWU12-2323]NWB88515.1 hydroxyacid dehydrogenase [Pseudomonas gingeri]
MARLLVAGKLHPTGVALLKEYERRGVIVDYVEEVSEASCAQLIGEADALVIRTQPLSAATIAKAKKLKVVSRHGVGYDSVDLQALNARGIGLTVVGDVNSISVAEHAMMQLLAGAKRAVRADRSVRKIGDWGWRNGLEQQEISGKNLLIIGYGRIGRHLANMSSGFNMQVRAFDPFLERAGWPEGPVRPISLEEGLAWADFISVHTPRGERPTLGPQEFALMKPGVIIANTARGGVVCEQALAEGLASGHVGAAGVDVFDDEPPTRQSVLLTQDTAILSPHIAGLTAECSERMAISSIENAMNFLAGTVDPTLVINSAHLDPLQPPSSA